MLLCQPSQHKQTHNAVTSRLLVHKLIIYVVSFTQLKNVNDLYTVLIKPNFFMCLQSLVLIAGESIIYLLKQSFCSWHRVALDERLIFACLKFSEGNVSTEMYFTSETTKQYQILMHSNFLGLPWLIGIHCFMERISSLEPFWWGYVINAHVHTHKGAQVHNVKKSLDSLVKTGMEQVSPCLPDTVDQLCAWSLTSHCKTTSGDYPSYSLSLWLKQ